MKQIQNIIKDALRIRQTNIDKDQKVLQTSQYLAMQRKKFVVETPIGFKPRSSSDFFLQN